MPGSWLAESAMQASYASVAGATLLWFSFIYLTIAGGAFLLALERLPERCGAACSR